MVSRGATFGLIATAALSSAMDHGAIAPTSKLGAALPVILVPGPHGPDPWRWQVDFARPRHIAALRARFAATTQGVPTRYRWEARGCDDAGWTALRDASADEQDPTSAGALPRRRTWFVDADACALRLVVTATNAGAPALEHVEVLDGARDVLRDTTRGELAGLTDGTYARAWTGEPGKGTWSLDVALPRPRRIDRARLVLGATATSVPRASGQAPMSAAARPARLGRDRALARAPRSWTLWGSADGATFTVLARAASATARRPLMRFPATTVVALRLTMEGATDDEGRPAAAASPMVRELSAYAADDAAPVLPEPWLLSVNANPAASAVGRGGQVFNDAYFAKFLQMRFAKLYPALILDDRTTRQVDDMGHWHEVAATASDGRVLESIEGDDPSLNEAWLTSSWPPPIVVLSGSNDWDYARTTTASPKGRTRWNPLASAKDGGMGDLASAVKGRAAPFLGFCGGAQILALLEAKAKGHGEEIDAILRRNDGRLIRGYATSAALIRAWPGEGRAAPRVTFDPLDPLFSDLAGPNGRTTTHALPQSHLDLMRPEAFMLGGPIPTFHVVATSLYCSPSISASLRPPAALPNPNGAGRCTRVTEAYRSVGSGWPVIGAQFHAEQKDFDTALAGDPPEAATDARLFFAAAYELVLDAYFAAATRTVPGAP